MPTLLTFTLADDGMATFQANGVDVLRGRLARVAGTGGDARGSGPVERRDVQGVSRMRWRSGGAEVRVAIARVTDAAVVWRVEVMGGDAGVDGTVATELNIAGAALGAVRHLPVLRALVVQGAGLVAVHTFVPDAGPGEDASAPGGGSGIARMLRLEPHAAAAFTGVVAVGASERAALEALFPFLSGERGREALREAHRTARTHEDEGSHAQR